MKLTDEQIKASQHIENPALVLAVPGAGKTTMLLVRTKNLIDRGVDPRRILSITFSRASARDMEARFFELWPDYTRRIQFSTIHSFAYSILRNYERRHGLEYTLIEGTKGLSKYKILREIILDTTHKWPNEDVLNDYIREISYVKNKLLDPKAFSTSKDCQTEQFLKIYKQYEAAKRKNHWIDFDDMILLAMQILEKDPGLRRGVQNAYDYVQIDEGQDTSNSQLSIVKTVVKPKNNLFIVADDDQSIYGFRGADFKGLLDLEKTYSNLTTYYLSTNFRSSKNIVDTSQTFIERNKYRFSKTMNAFHKTTAPIKVRKLKNLRAQYNYIIKEIQNNNLGETAILFRNNICSLGMIEALERENIEFNTRDTKNSFIYHWIVKDVLNILKFAEDPTDIDRYEKFYYKIKGYVSKKNIQALKEVKYTESVFQLLADMDIPSYLRRNLRELEIDFNSLAQADLPKALRIIEYDLDYRSYITRHSETFGSSKETSMRIFFYLKYIAKQAKDLKTFLGRLKHLDYLMKGKKITNSNITLSTMHGAKGLEFDTVFLIDLNEAMIPSKKKSDCHTKEEQLDYEEERRLFYVGMTRAKKQLYLLCPKTINHSPAKPSPFLEEIDAILKDK